MSAPEATCVSIANTLNKLLWRSRGRSRYYESAAQLCSVNCERARRCLSHPCTHFSAQVFVTVAGAVPRAGEEELAD